MAQWISACLFALSANIDNFPHRHCLRVVCASERRQPSHRMPYQSRYSGRNAAGRRAGTADPAGTANALGCMLLVLMGLWMLYREARAEWERRNSRLRTPVKRGWPAGKCRPLPPH